MTQPVLLPELDGIPHRLGRHIHHDPRSRDYPFRAPAGLTTIRDVAWKRRVPIYDQGQLGSCTAHAALGAVSTAPFKRRYTSERTIRQFYSAETKADDIPGSWPPDDTGSTGLAAAKCAQARGLISSYSHCFAFGDVLTALMVGPVIIGIPWYEGMFNPDAQGVVHPGGQIAGGHEIELLGVDTAARQVIAANSWGASWGPLGGYFRFTYADLTDLLAQQGDATVFHP